MTLPLRSLAVFALVLCCAGRGHGVGPGQPLLPSAPAPLADDTPAAGSQPASETIEIPGPLRSFLRMAGISQQADPADVLPLLARNVSLWGRENDKETEYLVLLNRYVRFARELQSLAGSDQSIRIANCDDAIRLVQILGYQFRQSCGSGDTSLMTGNAERAFLTLDSGFPLTTLEEDLQKHVPFTYGFVATHVPILFAERDWTALSQTKGKPRQDLLDVLLHDPNADRLYSAMARVDPQTRMVLAQSPGLKRLLLVSAVFDFYGSQICIQSGRVVVPGGPGAERGWQELVDASPGSPGEFVERLLAKDRGWLAAYFDAIARVSSAQQAHLTRAPLFRLLYDSYRPQAASDNAAAGVFPKNAELLLLFTRLAWDASGEPEVPGDISAWKDLFALDQKKLQLNVSGKHAHSIDSPERLLEGLVFLSKVETDVGPLQVYLSLSAINAGRQPDQQLSHPAVALLANNFVRFNNWYPIFAEFPALDDTSITSFIAAADQVDRISNQALRANALGSFQADIGLWQILARQGQIPPGKLNPSWQGVTHPFTAISGSGQLFEAARGSLQAILLAAAGDANLPQDQIVDLLAGPPQSTPDGKRVHQELVRRINAVLEDQHLVSLDSLFGLYDGLNDLAHGAHVGDNLLQLAGDLREFELPRPIFTEGEKASWSPIIYTNRHAELQIRTDLTSVIRTPGTPAQLEAARGRLAPFLRDTLVGLNYAYYEPPGAQVLHNNPLFVRSHDFSTVSVQGVQEIWGEPELIGIGVTAGGGAYLMGSLADLPYVLASVEQDFIAPGNVQALIWKETVPQILVDAIIPRWWNISPAELHAAALYQRAGEELFTAAREDSSLRQNVVAILGDRLPPGRLERIKAALRDPQGPPLLPDAALPSVTFYLAAEYRRRYPDKAALWGPAGRELDDLVRSDPDHASPQRLARDFGVPHLEMAQSDASDLLNTGLFPVSGGFTSRLFAESWQSTNLYWARLADELGYSPVMLNVLVPQLAHQMVINIFATNIDDWPALFRAMQQTGEEFRQGRIALQAAEKAHGQ